MKETTRVEVRLSPEEMETISRFSKKSTAQDGIYNLAKVFADFKLDNDDLQEIYKLLDFLKDFQEIPQYSGMSISFLLARLPGIICLLACTQKKEDENLDLESKTLTELKEICQENKEKYRGFSKFANSQNREQLIAHIRASNCLKSDNNPHWVV